MNLQLTDQVVFVAGSSRGIGRSIAETLLTEGARVAITGRSQEALEQARAAFSSRFPAERVLAIAGDFSNGDVIAAGFRSAVERFGRIDHLVANLGTGSGKPGWDQPGEEWERLFEANFFGATRLTQHVLPYLLGNESKGSILYISSIVAVEATPAPLPYSAAKAALNNYAKNLARQLGPQGVRVNTLAPGNIFFPGGSWERHLANRRDAVEQMLKTEVPIERFGTPEEIASFAAFLCSRQAAFATGSCFVVDGGQTRSL
jgi:3-oxoacyl-[acyl-carrier protein] reductase